MKKLKSLRLLAVLPLLLLVGCATTGEFVTETMSDKDYVKLTTEAQETYRNTITSEEEVLASKKEAEYQAGRPVHYGPPDNGYTLQWLKRLELVSWCKGHTTGNMGMESNMCQTVRADKNGSILYLSSKEAVMPTKFLQDTATQKGIGRVVAEGGFQVFGAIMNGTGAALINKSAGCSGSNCAPTFNVRGGAASAVNSADANSSSGITGTVAPAGGPGPGYGQDVSLPAY